MCVYVVGKFILQHWLRSELA